MTQLNTESDFDNLIHRVETLIGEVHGADAAPKPEAQRYAYRSQIHEFKALLDTSETFRDHPDALYYRARLAMALNLQEEALTLWRAAEQVGGRARKGLVHYHITICLKNLGSYYRARQSLATCRRLKFDPVLLGKLESELEFAEDQYTAHRTGAQFFGDLRKGVATREAKEAVTQSLRRIGLDRAQRECIAAICETLLAASSEPAARAEAADRSSASTGRHRQVFFAGFGWTGSGACFDYFQQGSRSVAPLGEGEISFYRRREFDAILQWGDAVGPETWSSLLQFIEIAVVGISGDSGGHPGVIYDSSVVHAVGDDAALGTALSSAVQSLIGAYSSGSLRSGFLDFVNTVSNLGPDDGTVHVFNNSVSGILANRLDSLPDAELVVVLRDMRDVYAARGIEASPMAPEAFIRTYTWCYNEFWKWYTDSPNKDRVQIIRFEDFVQSPDFRARLGNAIGIPVDTIDHGTGAYHPDQSLKNIGLYRTVEFQDEIEQIAEAFPDYVWDGPVQDSSVLTLLADDARPRTGARPAAWVAPAPETGEPALVNALGINPVGFRISPDHGHGRFRMDTGSLVVPSDGDRPVVLMNGSRLTASVLDAVRECRSVELEWSAERPDNGVVHKIRQLATMGAPLTSGPMVPPWAREALGDAMLATLQRFEPKQLDDDLLRELHSVRIRRNGLDRYSTIRTGTVADSGSGTDLPTVSAVLCTNRPEHTESALRQLTLQRYPALEIILVLHGIEAEPLRAPLAALELDLPLTVVEVPKSEIFGNALNVGIDAASGTLITKIDDDDWYGPNHIWDLVRAFRYADADLVGGFAEFVYLASLGLTLYRPAGGGEKFDSTVSGGTLMASREFLREIDGFVPVPTAADVALISKIRDQGGRVYRTHGMEYVLHRHESGHTWAAPPRHFLESSKRQWYGTNLADLVVRDELEKAFL